MPDVKALVTGHSGFLGSHASRAFVDAGWAVVGTGRPDVEIPSDAFAALLRESAPDVVVHCAGPASVQAAEGQPGADYAGSVAVVESLVSLMRELKRVPRLLLVSSAAVYGNPPALPVTTDTPLRPISAYGTHRVEAELVALSSDVPVAIARVFSAYGEGLRRQVWWDIARMALAGDVVLAGDGKESRDFVHGEDVGRALSTIAHSCSFTGEIFNVAAGVETRVRDLAEGLIAHVAPGAVVRFTGESRPGDPRRWRAEISSLQSAGFEPRITLDEGIERYARWIVTQ